MHSPPLPSHSQVSGFFFPGFDGLSGSARCKFGDQLSTPTVLEASNGIIVCASPTRAASPARTEAGGAGFEDVTFQIALNTVDFVGNENVTFRYYDHFLSSISPRGGHLQGNTEVVISGDRFDLLTSISAASASLVRCRFGNHDAVQGEIFTLQVDLLRLHTLHWPLSFSPSPLASSLPLPYPPPILASPVFSCRASCISYCLLTPSDSF